MHVQKSQHTTELLLYASRTCVDTNAHTHTHHKYRRAISHGIRLDFDTALLTSLPSALQKDPASRGTFDNVVVTNVEDELQKRPQGAPRAVFPNSGGAAMIFKQGLVSSQVGKTEGDAG